MATKVFFRQALVAALLWSPARPALADTPIVPEPGPGAVAGFAFPAGDQDEIPLHCRPEVITAFEEIWKRVRFGREDYEAGFRIDRRGDIYTIEYAPMTYEDMKLVISRIPGVTVAIVHTHPDNADPRPLGQDLKSPVPNYVVSKRALWVTDPETKRAKRLRGVWNKPCK